MKTSHAAIVVTIVGLVAPQRAFAQNPLATPGTGFTVEAGAFIYDPERGAGDGGVRLNFALGWRGLREPWFVEPNLRLLPRLSSRRTDDSCSGFPCDGAIAAEPLAEFWPGLTVGASFGDERFSQSAALRLAFGVGERMHPLVALRYEGSARRAGWFLEGSIDRARWAELENDDSGSAFVAETTSGWKPAVSVGLRLWFRRTGAPVPTGPSHPDLRNTDAGIIPPDPPSKPAEEEEDAEPEEREPPI